MFLARYESRLNLADFEVLGVHNAANLAAFFSDAHRMLTKHTW